MNDQLHRPYLSQEEVADRLEKLGFEFQGGPHGPRRVLEDTPHGREAFQALQELIAGAIGEWADVEPHDTATTWETINDELNDWSQEWLVG